MLSPVLDPTLLQAFVAVADRRSFTRAAASLNRTQSAVSMQIKRLEERFGVELFHRGATGVQLSAAGEGLLGYARRILHLNHEAMTRLSEHSIDGCVRIGVMDDYGAVILPPLLASFAANYPGIQVEMETGLSSTMVDRVGEAFDLAIVIHPEGKGDGRFLRREQAVWAASPSFTIDQFERLPLALYPPGCLFRKWGMEALDAAARPWRLAFVSHSLDAVTAIAAQGLAVTIVKSGVFPSRLRRLSTDDGLPPLPRADLHLHSAPGLSRPAGLLGDHLTAALSQPV